MGQKSTTTTTIPSAGKAEGQMLALLQQLAQKFGGQLGDLSSLAQGNVGGPTAEDVDLVNRSIGASGDIARRQLERDLGPILAQIMESNTARGVQGASFEGLNKMLGTRELTGRYADMLSQAQGQGAQALLNLPFQRAETKIGANQALFNMLSGAANPVLQSTLQARMAQPTQTTKTPFSPMQAFQLASGLGSLPFNFGGGGGGGGQQDQQAYNLVSMINPFTGTLK